MAKAPRKSAKPAKPEGVPVESLTHATDSRSNIPTRELAGFQADGDGKPKRVLYPRDPSLDPQLVWKGKDEQDAHPLEVPAVPIYVQEKIHPQAIIEDVRRRAESRKAPDVVQPDLFADFNGLDDLHRNKKGRESLLKKTPDPFAIDRRRRRAAGDWSPGGRVGRE